MSENAVKPVELVEQIAVVAVVPAAPAVVVVAVGVIAWQSQPEYDLVGWQVCVDGGCDCGG